MRTRGRDSFLPAREPLHRIVCRVPDPHLRTPIAKGIPLQGWEPGPDHSGPLPALLSTKERLKRALACQEHQFIGLRRELCSLVGSRASPYRLLSSRRVWSKVW